jgi:hypothetical protein
LNGATVQGRAIVVNKSEPNQKEKEEVLTITVVVEIHAVVMVVETAVEKTVVVETGYYSFSTTIKKKGQFKCPFWLILFGYFMFIMVILLFTI